MLQAPDSGCFLARALSISEQQGETVSFLVAPVGPGTRELCSLGKGEEVWVLGPLGNGFDLEAMLDGAGRVVLVAGGAGIAPFPLLVSELAKLVSSEARSDGRGTRPEILALAGFRDAQQSLSCGPLTEVVDRVAGDGVVCVYDQVLESDPDSPSERATDLLARHLRSGDRLAVCGPEAMASAVWQVCKRVPGVKAWFSLETKMACGVGSCHGCVVTLADGSYARVCREGPVFAGEVVFGG
jgi:dihydroorotate dehydrogenase electron transfer subunit